MIPVYDIIVFPLLFFLGWFFPAGYLVLVIVVVLVVVLVVVVVVVVPTSRISTVGFLSIGRPETVFSLW